MNLIQSYVSPLYSSAKAGEYHLDVDDTLDDSNHDLMSMSSGAGAAMAKFKTAVNSIRGYKKGEAETIRRVLDEIEVISVKRMSEGFNEFNFSVGVFNCVSRSMIYLS